MGPLIKWEPGLGLSRLRDDMSRLIEDFFGEVSEERLPSGEMMRIPSIDVVDKDAEIIVHAEMPGINKENIQLQATPDSLIIHAEIRQENEEKKENYLRRERRVGLFHRMIPMPVEVKPGEVKATYHDGILEITLPKSEQARSRQPVKVRIE